METIQSRERRSLDFPGRRLRIFGDVRPGVFRFLLLLLAVDAVFILLHVIYKLPVVFPALNLSLGQEFAMNQDGGYAEVFQYLKEGFIVLVLSLVALRIRSYIGWALLFVYLLADDSFKIHEKLGGLVGERFDFPALFNLQARDIGELAVSAVFGLFLLAAIAIAYRLGDRRFRKSSRYLLLMLFALAATGIVADMLHEMTDPRLLRALFSIIEDGGEMVVMSVIACFVLSLGFSRSRDPNGAAEVLERQGGHDYPHA